MQNFQWISVVSFTGLLQDFGSSVLKQFQCRFGCQNISGRSSMFLALSGKFSEKICSFGSIHCSLHPYKSHSPFCWKAPPQHDATTTMLRGRSAIRRVMSCARFPPDRELCFMAESSVSISSEQTLLPLASLKSLSSAFLPRPGCCL